MIEASAAPRAVILCADDYGLAPGVSAAIAELIAAGRLSATSCMSGAGAWRAHVALLRAAVATRPADVGLHLTLTDHAALTGASDLAPGGRLPPLSRLLPAALARRLPTTAVADELRAQLDAFEDAWGAAPDYVDGHQHVHLLPGVREAVVAELVRRYPRGGVWVRDCTEPRRRILRRGVAVPKALFIGALGQGLVRLAAAAGLPMNEGFSGLHDFSGRQPFRVLMQRFLSHPGPRPLVHVHPGRVDAALAACDSLTTPRERELDYLASPAFAEDLAVAGVRLARFVETGAGAEGRRGAV